MDNGEQLRAIIEKSGLTQDAALTLCNEGQVRPLSVSQWKAYIAHPNSARRSPCPDGVLAHAKKVLPVP